MISESILCLAAVIFHEARGEPELGKLAVANVVINRTKTRNLNECQVVKQKRQFSWYRGQSQIDKMRNPKYEEYLKLANKARARDVTNGATFFHATTVCPNWSYYLIRSKSIGGHRFYRELDTKSNSTKRRINNDCRW